MTSTNQIPPLIPDNEDGKSLFRFIIIGFTEEHVETLIVEWPQKIYVIAREDLGKIRQRIEVGDVLGALVDSDAESSADLNPSHWDFFARDWRHVVTPEMLNIPAESLPENWKPIQKETSRWGYSVKSKHAGYSEKTFDTREQAIEAGKKAMLKAGKTFFWVAPVRLLTTEDVIDAEFALGTMRLVHYKMRSITGQEKIPDWGYNDTYAWNEELVKIQKKTGSEILGKIMESVRDSIDQVLPIRIHVPTGEPLQMDCEEVIGSPAYERKTQQ